jgi:molybdopterin synthase sulfur carrier subunit
MEWKLFADLAEIAGDKRVSVDVEPGSTVGDALDALLAANPELEDRVVTEDGQLHEHITLLRNGTNVLVEDDGLAASTTDDDELALFPPVSGG